MTTKIGISNHVTLTQIGEYDIIVSYNGFMAKMNNYEPVKNLLNIMNDIEEQANQRFNTAPGVNSLQHKELTSAVYATLPVTHDDDEIPF